MTTTTLEKKVLYTAKVHTTGGRDGGASRSDDGRLDIKHSSPGSAGSGTNVSVPGLTREVAQALVDAADQTCPYSKATRGNIDVVINVI
jgi:osmotically inducible protein OsmC